jgi:hypothetical protein
MHLCDKPGCDTPGSKLTPVESRGGRFWALLCKKHFLFPNDPRPGSQIESVEARYRDIRYSEGGG